MDRSIRDALVEKIWEGTTSVLALDLVRSANDPTVFAAFTNVSSSSCSIDKMLENLTVSKWGSKILDSCPPELGSKVGTPLEAVKAAFQTIADVYHHPTRISPLLPRPGLMLVGYAASAAMLLEHAVWSHNMKTSDRDVDVEVFVRWANEGGLSSSLREVVEIAAGHDRERISMNSILAYGPRL